MLIDRPNVREGSYIENAVVPSGTSNPTSPNQGELFFRTDLGSLLTYNGSTWVEVGAIALAAHEANAALHLTPAQNTLLDGLAGTLTAAELNFVDGVTSPIQTQLNTQATNLSNEIARATGAEASLQAQITANDSSFDTHAADQTLHLTSAQNTLLDGLAGTLTAAELNFVDGVTSNIQTQLNQKTTDLNTHAADTTLHLTSGQNTFLDNITVTFADVNRLAGIDSYLTSVSSANIGSYLATLTSTKVAKSGDTMTGNLVMSSGARVTGLPIPSADSDAANKAYVDALAGGIDWKEAVVAATTGAIALTGLQTIDGVAVAHNQRVLVKDQGSPSQNGVYIVNSGGAWSRAADYDSALEVSQSAVYVMAGGTANGRGSFVQTANITTIGVDPINFTPFTGPVVNSAGNGISLGVGGLVSVKESYGITFDGGGNVAVDLFAGGGLMTTTDNTNSSTAANAQLALTNVGTAGTYRSVTTDSKGRVTAGTNPTTLAGYGITDAQPLDADLTAIDNIGTLGLAVRQTPGVWVTRSVAVSGNGLSITNADGTAGNPTVTSNATNANTPSTIVYRDGAGNFSAGTITASLAGNATSATTATTATTATNNVLKSGDTMTGALQVGIGVGHTRIQLGNASNPGFMEFYTADNTRRGYIGWNNGSSRLNIVGEAGWAWDFNTTPTVVNSAIWHAGNDGSGSGLDADLLDGRQSWSSGANWGVVPFVETNGVLEVGRYIDFHTTNAGVTDFDARLWSGPTSYGTLLLSGSTGGYQGFQFADVADLRTFMARTSDGLHGMFRVGTSAWDWYYDPGSSNILMNGTNPVLHTGNYSSYAPTLTGGGASGTWSINITGNAASVGGYGASIATTPNTIPVRDGSGYTYFNYISSNTGNSENPSVSQIIVTNGDNFYRKASPGHVLNTLSSFNAIITGAWHFQTSGNTDTGLNPPLQAYSTGANGAWMSFHRSAGYAVNMGLDTDNVFRIGGWSAPANRMQLDMSGNVTFAGDVTAFSDRRLKTDIEPVYSALEKILSLNGVTFKRIDTGEFGVGLVAQEVQAVIPEVVKEQADGMLSVAYGNMVGVLVEAIKDLNKQVQELKAQLAASKEAEE